MNIQKHILLFDGVCNLCNRLVLFVIKWDKKEKIKFASLQSSIGQVLLKELNLSLIDFDTLVYLKGDNKFTKSNAVLEVLKDLGSFWKFFYIFILIPNRLRDIVYNLVAKTRYKVFGKQNNCLLPTIEIKDRFLDDIN